MVKIVGVKQTLIIAKVDKSFLTHKAAPASLGIFFDCNGKKKITGASLLLLFLYNCCQLYIKITTKNIFHYFSKSKPLNIPIINPISVLNIAKKRRIFLPAKFFIPIGDFYR